MSFESCQVTYVNSYVKYIFRYINLFIGMNSAVILNLTIDVLTKCTFVGLFILITARSEFDADYSDLLINYYCCASPRMCGIFVPLINKYFIPITSLILSFQVFQVFFYWKIVIIKKNHLELLDARKRRAQSYADWEFENNCSIFSRTS